MITQETVDLVNKLFRTSIKYDNKYHTSILDTNYLSSLPDNDYLYIQLKYAGEYFEFKCEKNPTQFEIEKAFLKCLSKRKNNLNKEMLNIDLIGFDFLTKIKDL